MEARSVQVPGVAPRSILLGLVAALAVASGCGGGSSSSPTGPGALAAVEFVYQAATTTDPDVQALFPECVSGVGITHIHPSWRGFARVLMTPSGAMEWRIGFADVPVGSEQRIRISDPNACVLNPTGASTENVFANGILLQRIVDTPGSGTEPGLAFTVDRNGNVQP